MSTVNAPQSGKERGGGVARRLRKVLAVFFSAIIVTSLMPSVSWAEAVEGPSVATTTQESAAVTTQPDSSSWAETDEEESGTISPAATTDASVPTMNDFPSPNTDAASAATDGFSSSTQDAASTSEDYQADLDASGYTQTVNGYIAHQSESVTTTTAEDTPQGKMTCTETTRPYTDEVDLNAKSVMDTELTDYSNNGYLEKVRNCNNHSNVSAEDSGPGNLEVQHWQDGVNSSTTQQNWRIAFATDYAINDATMTVVLPEDGYVYSDVTSWLLNKHYPAVSQGVTYYTSAIAPESITINGQIATIVLGDIPAGSVFGIQFTKTFDAPQDFSKDLKVASAHVSGIWDVSTMAGDEKYVKTSKSEPEYITGSCTLIPFESATPSGPTDSSGPATLSQAAYCSEVASGASGACPDAGVLPKTGDAGVDVATGVGIAGILGLAFIVIGKILKSRREKYL